MDNRIRSYLTLFLFLLALPAYGQFGQSYDVSARPDLWYNDVDGIRLGMVLRGRVPGLPDESPHRLNAGVWLGTWFPDLPVSYSSTYTEPVPALSDYGSEFNVQLSSSVSEGYFEHGVSVRKRWQDLFDYMTYWEASLGFSLEKRFNHEYAVFPELWSDDLKGLVRPRLAHQHLNSAGYFNLDLSSRINTSGPFFYTAAVAATQQIHIRESWEIRIRAYGETVSENTYPEYRLLLSSGPEISTLDSRLSRAKGTVPAGWVRNGTVHFSGGPNVRGYTDPDAGLVRDGMPVLYTSSAAVNVELDVPNPLQTVIRGDPRISEFLSFRSYAFSDAAFAGGQTPGRDGLYANAGAGLALSVNIPDYLGKPRGFVIRYEVPFWLSEPGSDPAWKWRHLLGIGATIRI